MTMIDEGTLITALRQAADDFTISKDASARILNEARSSTHDEPAYRMRTLYRRYGRGRTIAMAVAAGVVALGITAPLVRIESGSTTGAVAKFGAIQKTAHGSTPGLGPFRVAQGAVAGTSLSPWNATLTVTGSGLSSNPRSTTVGNALRVEEVGAIDLSVTKKKFGSAFSELSTMAVTFGGFVANTQIQIGNKTSGTYSSGTLVLQVPQRDFAKLVNHVRQIGFATSVVTSTTDVTGQYVDLQARISALQVSRQQYLKIMDRTSSIDGVLAVQHQLDALQSQIEQLQGQMNLLNSETTYGTLTVSLSEAGHTPVAPRPGSGIDRAWHDAIRGFVAGFEWLIRIAGPLLFALICLAALVVIGQLVWRARSRRGA
jgi:hypothetical protein